MTVGEKLSFLRKKNGYSQEFLASQITVSRQAVSKWELDESLPDTENVRQLAKLYGVTTDALLEDEIDIMESIIPKDDAEAAVMLELLGDELDGSDKQALRVRVARKQRKKKK